MEDSGWVFDSLVEFLHGPVWNIPIQTFVEDNSLVFEPTDVINEQNDDQQKTIFEDYKNLVDLMLGSYMEDIGISPEQFEAACEMSKKSDRSTLHFERLLFEQIWAANDYEMFARMMRQKNIELQIQALELIEKRYGAVSHNHEEETIDQQTPHSSDWTDQHYIMEEVKKIALAEAKDDDDEVVIKPDAEEIQNQKMSLQENFDKIEKYYFPAIVDHNIQQKQNISAMLNENLSILEGEGTTEDRTSNGKSLQETAIINKNIQPEEIEQRQVYLKQQRDKLLALKKQARGKQLEISTPLQRPKSARTAQMILAGEKMAAAGPSLQIRKALADRLKAEVLHDGEQGRSDKPPMA